jgi:hypothetical protein
MRVVNFGLFLLLLPVQFLFGQKISEFEGNFPLIETPVKERKFITEIFKEDTKPLDIKLADKFLKAESVSKIKSQNITLTKETLPICRVSHQDITVYFYAYYLNQSNKDKRSFAGYVMTSYYKGKRVEEKLLALNQDYKVDVQRSESGLFVIQVVGGPKAEAFTVQKDGRVKNVF